MIPVSASIRVRERLLASPDGPLPVLHRGPHAVYLDLRGWCLGVVGTAAAAVPNALRTATPDLSGLAARSATLLDGVLHLDGEPLVVGRLVDVRVPRLSPSSVTRADGVPGAASLDAPLDAGEVARLVGAGDGLTPYGDDVLCGWLAVHRAAGVATAPVDAALRSLLHRTTLLSATLLDCALHGEVLPEFASYVAALGTPAETARAADLTAIGHTSGAGLLAGARRALAELEGQAIGAAA